MEKTSDSKTMEEVIEELQKEIARLSEDNLKARSILDEFGMSVDDRNISQIERICLEQIERLSELNVTFDKDEAKILETLQSVLARERGKEKAKRKVKATHSAADLMELVKGGKK